MTFNKEVKSIDAAVRHHFSIVGEAVVIVVSATSVIYNLTIKINRVGFGLAKMQIKCFDIVTSTHLGDICGVNIVSKVV